MNAKARTGSKLSGQNLVKERIEVVLDVAPLTRRQRLKFPCVIRSEQHAGNVRRVAHRATNVFDSGSAR
jgi:hypothetical protein